MHQSETSEKSENLYTNSDFRTPIVGHPRSLSGGVSTSVLSKTEKTFSDRFRSFRGRSRHRQAAKILTMKTLL